MEAFRAYYTDIRSSDWQQQAAAQLRELGVLTFSGIAERARLIGLARQLMTIRPHRDADAEGVTVITRTRDESSGYAGFTDAELIPHTDGSAESNPPGLLLLACQQAADEGGSTRVVDGARVTRGTRRPAPRRPGPAVCTTVRFLRGSRRLPRRPAGTSRARPEAYKAPARRPGLVLHRSGRDDPAAASSDRRAHANIPAPRGRRAAPQ
jgi:alpha-ketoglutarate-dependent taurine dioxygenase